MHPRTTELTLQFLQEHEGPVFTPIFRWIERFVNNPATCPGVADSGLLEQLARRLIKPWSKHMHVWQVLDGYNSEHVRQAAAPELCALLLEIEGYERGGQLATTPEEAACPTVQCEGTAGDFLPVGAHHVSECIAQIQEGFAGINPEQVSPVYFVLLLLGKDYLDRTEQIVDKRDRHLELTSLVLADLSLFTPIGCTYGHLRHAGLDWSALHPGWRYCHALELVAKEDWWISSLFEAEALIERICDRLGWPSPHRFLEHGAQLAGSNELRHRDACKIRLRDFMAFYRRDRIVESGSAVADFLSEHLPMVHYPSMGTVCNVTPADTDNSIALQQLRDCFLTRCYSDAMLQSMRERVLPPECRFDLYFDDVSNEDDLARLIAQKYPWLEITRFVRL
jgi:hypothetical protein